ncbi:MAG: 2-C-methyl-D-erythritol 2,4-cyclodiphosphate synthase [Candidatus Abyssobacteria bacterium SURF_17]|uniref:2-C-methyl-D-erythritol 2,4-cyclodiphosphate synthase n=1 Tax=Candidatus Abyssobacteria bacterium SURF_17 TaxID=2093361 RepID=A0A419F8S9_9BACT|nr:MAG: 2-C-methyl-D-erythritol 2,4-cyclodiphosphate synthase [Candidatus Abyssubacteria bacterium SURF_17]
MRVGLGFDVHRFAEGDGVTLGGVKIPFGKKLVGHSDADALCHAIIDALLGAASLGDIGEHFPDTDPKYKGASSIGLLRRAAAEVSAAGYTICNVDAVVVTERPRLLEFKQKMERMIADAIGVESGCVSVKAKTAEGLGPVGAGDALCAQAVALIA